MSSMMPLKPRQEKSKEFDEVERRLTDLREGGGKGPTYWRSLEELAQTDEFEAYLQHEFPEQAAVWNDPQSRRQFLRLMGASLALAGLTGCGPGPAEKILPYVKQPELITLGKPLFFATAHVKDGYADGILVESHQGRPIKVEGNPMHPSSFGATDIYAQASVLTLYDPDRSSTILYGDNIETWGTFLDNLSLELAFQEPRGGQGIRILTETITSPSLAALMGRVLETYPQAKWHQWEPVHADYELQASRMAFGREVSTRFRIDQAGAILSIDRDFLTTGPGNLVYAREWAKRRRVDPDHPEEVHMPRLYMVESTPTLTGGLADHHRTLGEQEIEAFTYELAQLLGVPVQGWDGPTGLPVPEAWMAALVDDLMNYSIPGGPDTPLVIAGNHLPPRVQALVCAINERIGAAGRTVIYSEPVIANPVDHTESLRELIEDMMAGQVEMLIILGGNPVFNAPADFNFLEAMRQVQFRAHLSLYEDETSLHCPWHIAETHALESWGDARAYDGTITMIQPLIAPLYAGKSAYEVLAAMLGEGGRTNYELVQDFWRETLAAENFEKEWQRILHDGFILGSDLPPIDVRVQGNFLQMPALPPVEQLPPGPPSAGPEAETAAAAAATTPTEAAEERTYGPQGRVVAEGWDIVFRPDPTIWDGSYANNGWLQELPKPLSKLTWDNAAFISPTTGERVGLYSMDVIEIEVAGRTVLAPVWQLPGHPENAITVNFGYGRERIGRVGWEQGFNAYAIRTSDRPWSAKTGRIRRTGEHYSLACTQNHYLMHGRDLVKVGTAEEYNEHPDEPHFMHAAGEHHEPASLYPEYVYTGYKWGMAINTGTCTGCSACVVACQAENNIPIVGKPEVQNSREMHWLRIDRYYSGETDNPDVLHQPIPCMQCEKAPCEPVCPVHATVHSDEGLNDMVYNRCIGTRYCSNNCPYKVRRFNFLQYADAVEESLKLGRNPDVSVRPRGVMEKCTYCVQRIVAARTEAEIESRTIRDGEVKTACQAACPTQAIVFGDLNDESAQVRHLQNLAINYPLLEQLNTHPRTTYLAALRNPNPKLADL